MKLETIETTEKIIGFTDEEQQEFDERQQLLKQYVYKPNAIRDAKSALEAKLLKAKLRYMLSIAQDDCCNVCHNSLESVGRSSLNWIKRRSEGGADVWENYELLCRRCKADVSGYGG